MSISMFYPLLNKKFEKSKYGMPFLGEDSKLRILYR
jgi:hypothetical protein